MSQQEFSLPNVLLESFKDPTFLAAVQDVLEWVPELKHEGLVCTHLSSALPKKGVRSRREVSLHPRRFDMQIEGVNLEAKYHHDGDLHEVRDSFRNGYVYDPKHYNSATKAIHQELNRGPSWFLWMVCVRDVNEITQTVFPHLVKRFYKKTKANSFAEALVKAEEIMSGDIAAAFKTQVACTTYELPTIKAKHSALVSRLYFVDTRNT